MLGASRTGDRRVFRSMGPATEQARCASLVRVQETSCSDRREELLVTDEITWLRFIRTVAVMGEEHEDGELESILKSTGSQWTCRSARVMWSFGWRLKTSLAAACRTRCSGADQTEWRYSSLDEIELRLRRAVSWRTGRYDDADDVGGEDCHLLMCKFSHLWIKPYAEVACSGGRLNPSSVNMRVIAMNIRFLNK